MNVNIHRRMPPFYATRACALGVATSWAKFETLSETAVFYAKRGGQLRGNGDFCALCGAPVFPYAKPGDLCDLRDSGDNPLPEPPGSRKPRGWKKESNLPMPAASR